MLVQARRFPGKSLWQASSALSNRLEYWRQEIEERLDEYSGSGYSVSAAEKMRLRQAAVTRALELVNEAEDVLFAMP